MRIIGITGGIASGKTTACNYLREKDIPIIDSDKLVHRLQSEDKDLQSKIREHFPTVFDGDDLNRAKLSSLAEKSEVLEKLQELTFPFVINEIKNMIEAFKASDTPLLVIEAPLLFESGIDYLCNTTVAIYTDEDKQRANALSRLDMSERKFNTIISHQLTCKERNNKADIVIYNACDESFRKEVLALINNDKQR